MLGCYVPHVCEISLSRTHRKGSSDGYVKTTIRESFTLFYYDTAVVFFSWLTRFFFRHRTVHGPKKQLRVYSTKIVPSHTPYLSFHSRFGCWARRIAIWQNSNSAQLRVKRLAMGTDMQMEVIVECSVNLRFPQYSISFQADLTVTFTNGICRCCVCIP